MKICDTIKTSNERILAMKQIRFFAGVLALLMLCTGLLSCKKKEEPTPPPAETAPPPLTEGQKIDYTEDAELQATLDALYRTFEGLEARPTTEFLYTEGEDGVTVTAYQGEASVVRIPDTVNQKPVVAVAAQAFAQNTALTAVYLPDSVVRVGTGAFQNCTSLKALRTPVLGESDKTQFLGYAFGAKNYLDNPIHVPPSLAYLELGGSASTLWEFSLFDCNDLIALRLPTGMTALGSYSLYECRSLVAVNTAHLTKVGDYAMRSCAALTRLDFGNSLTSIGLGAFEGCVSLRRMTLPFVGGSANENTYLGYIFGATLPEFAKGYYPPYLCEITLSAGVGSLGDHAFFECESLTDIHLPDGVMSVGIRAFAGCIRLRSVSLPNSVTAIRENAFFGCKSLQSVSLGNSLQTLGINAFYNCISLQSVTLPHTLTALPASCFAGCRTLASIDLGGVQTVEAKALYGCDALTSLVSSQKLTFEKGNDTAKALWEQQNKKQ